MNRSFARCCPRNFLVFLTALAILFTASPPPRVTASPPPRVTASHAAPRTAEYLWYEAEDMRGFATQPTGEPVLNPSWQNPPKAKAPGWGMNGTGTSAEWSHGGSSEWGSAAASADETHARIYQDVEIPRTGEYNVWARYADWANKTEAFIIKITQGGRDVFRHEFGTKDLVDPHDELAMYWGWVFTWDKALTKLKKGPARISLEIERATEARRHVDSVLLTNDLAYVADGRRKPDFAAMRYLRGWSMNRSPVASLLTPSSSHAVPAAWQHAKFAGRDFMMPWNISTEFWKLYDKPPAERPLYPFNAEPIEEFVKKYKSALDVPIFSSRLVVPVIYINNLPEYFREGSAFLRYLRETKVPFAVLINYGDAAMSPKEGQAAWTLLTGEFKEQFLGWISGESVGYVWPSAANELKISSHMSRRELQEAHRVFYTNALAQKWADTFHTETGPMWDKLIPAQSSSSTSFAHPLTGWGVRLLGMESAAVQPMFGMRIAFTRGAARQFGGNFLYYHAPNFGDTATTFTKAQNFAGPDHFFHSRYGTTMGPSLSWYRKSYFLYYMSGASAIYLEQGGDQFFKPGPGDHDFQLNPLGRITDEFVRFVEKHPDRGTSYTPVAFLLDPAHGWEMTDYPHWPFGLSQISRHDRALRQLFGVAFYPGLVVEGEPPTGDRQAFVNGIFGNIFDVLTASEIESQPLRAKSGSKNNERVPAINTAEKKPTAPQPKKRTTEPAPARSATAKAKREEGEYFGSDPAQIIPKQTSTATTSAAAATPTAVVADAPAAPRASIAHVRAAPLPILDTYRAIVVGGHIEWPKNWIPKIQDYVKSGGTLVVNAAQIKMLPASLVGVSLTGNSNEADRARCLSPGETPHDLSGQMFRYEKVELKGAQPFITTESGDPLVTVNKVGKGSVIFAALPDLLGYDERITPFAAHMLAHVFSDATPVKVRGDVEHLINRNAKGWVVTLFNNNGVYKPAHGLAQVDRTAYVTATISLPGSQIQSAVDWIDDKRIEAKNVNGESVVSVSIAPGAVAVIELKAR
jgi:hypothetical protein